MIILDERKSNSCKFKDLPIGSTFHNLKGLDPESLFYKIRSSDQSLPSKFSREVYSEPDLGFCVNLRTNELMTIGLGNLVEKVDTILTIKK